MHKHTTTSNTLITCRTFSQWSRRLESRLLTSGSSLSRARGTSKANLLSRRLRAGKSANVRAFSAKMAVARRTKHRKHKHSQLRPRKLYKTGETFDRFPSRSTAQSVVGNGLLDRVYAKTWYLCRVICCKLNFELARSSRNIG